MDLLALERSVDALHAFDGTFLDASLKDSTCFEAFSGVRGPLIGDFYFEEFDVEEGLALVGNAHYHLDLFDASYEQIAVEMAGRTDSVDCLCAWPAPPISCSAVTTAEGTLAISPEHRSVLGAAVAGRNPSQKKRRFPASTKTMY